MSHESEIEKKSNPPRQGQSRNARRQSWTDRMNSWVHVVINRLQDRLYDIWFPLSEGSQGYYGYGPVRQNRIKWLWRRGRRWFRKSAAGAALLKLKGRWFDPWYNRWYDWWYPVSDKVQTYGYSYGAGRRNRLVRDWRRLKRSVRNSAFGRRCRTWFDRFYEWYFPMVKGSRYGYGYGYASYYRMSRPERFVRRLARRFRQTWLGRKTGWVLDEIESIIRENGLNAARDFAWQKIVY